MTHNNTKHTPGPWKVSDYGNDFFVIISDKDYHVAKVGKFGEGGNKANAKLIAAAPELLAFVKKVLPYLNATGTNGNHYVKEGAALLIKAGDTDTGFPDIETPVFL